MQVEGLPDVPGEHKKSKAATKAPKMKRIPSVQGIETDLAKAVRLPAPCFWAYCTLTGFQYWGIDYAETVHIVGRNPENKHFSVHDLGLIKNVACFSAMRPVVTRVGRRRPVIYACLSFIPSACWMCRSNVRVCSLWQQ